MKKKILVLTTYDSFFLKNLIVKLVNKTKNNFEYNFIFVSDYMKFKNIIVKFLSFGVVSSLLLLIKSIINKTKKKCLSQIFKNKTINLNEIKTIKYKKKYDLILSINFPHLITRKYLDLAKYGGINHHLGKLPKYAGRYPVAKAILNNEKEIVITIHSLSKNFDSGKVISQTPINISTCKNNFYKIYEQVFMNSLNPLLAVLGKKTKYNYNSKNKIKIKKLKLRKLLFFYFLNQFK